MNLKEWGEKVREKVLTFGLKEWGMLLVAGLCCLIIVFPFDNPEKPVTETERQQEIIPENEKEAGYVEQLEQRLTELLSSVENVGEVRVMITVSGSAEKQVLKDGKTEREQNVEQDGAGGSRNQVSERSEGTTVFAELHGENSPYILGETYPEITGVVVLARGSGKGTVDFDILNAVQVLFDVPAHKIKIMKLK